MTVLTVPHTPLDILPVPANRVFCKACSTVHTTRAQLCPALRLDICAIHKTVFLPHEKSVYQNSHLQDVDTECPDCMYGSEKKLNRALSRSNSRALRASITHKDVVFCVYCWAPATKKCTHLSSCREHSYLYIRSQVDINSKWWLRPSDFACLLCPMNGVMPKKAQEWRKERASAPASGFFGPDWDDWPDYIGDQITRLHPGAFQSLEARCEYVTWMDGLGENEMLYLRYLAYQGVHPITIIYAETGTVPRMIQYGRFEPPPPYAVQPSTDATHVSTPSTGNASGNATTPVQSTVLPMPPVPPHNHIPAMPSSATQLSRSATFTGPGRTLRDSGIPQIMYREVQPPRQPQYQSMHSRAPSRQPILVPPPQFQTNHISHPSQNPYAQAQNSVGQLALHGVPHIANHHRPMQSQTSQWHHSQHSLQNAPPIDPNPRRVSFAPPVPPQVPISQHQIPSNGPPIQYRIPPHTIGPQIVPQSTTNPSMARFLEQLRAARTPTQSRHHNTPSTLPGAYPTGHPADDDDWETTTDFSETDTPSSASPMPQVPLPSQYPAHHEALSYQGVPQRNPMYAAFQQAYAQAAGGAPAQYRRPAHPFAPIS